MKLGKTLWSSYVVIRYDIGTPRPSWTFNSKYKVKSKGSESNFLPYTGYILRDLGSKTERLILSFDNFNSRNKGRRLRRFPSLYHSHKVTEIVMVPSIVCWPVSYILTFSDISSCRSSFLIFMYLDVNLTNPNLESKKSMVDKLDSV